ncbi:hypothetical protein [Planobispora longispora]|uniref:Uncharacterized protein n=1 Tax=Planobispora longispora TaxID=28887 RepID=A0A8J3W7J7_9ACTN|nr:hypothetical protein [Planobispora longispora]BFE82405.1 hypothetical protein GCM10020093_050060 [Planobispora longispora]GIH78905.1 hypothetical protein Plo01_53340 [Planobispora longispora]
MPSPQHDSLIDLFRDRPQLAVELLRDLLGHDLPTTTLVREENSTFNTRPSDDLEADLVLVLGPPQAPAHAIVVEIQKDTSKDPRQLARYAAAFWLQLRCAVTVLVVCPDVRTAAYYARPIDSGLPGYRLQACVLGPDAIPAITDAHQAAAQPELATLAVMVHGRERKVVEAFAAALADLPDDHAPKYYEYAYGMSAPDVRRLLEEIMTSTSWPVYSPFAREHYGRGREEGRAEGRAEGETKGGVREAARMVLLVLATRGLEVPDEVRDRITACTDLARLESWAARAVTARTVHDLFDETAAGDH